MRKCKAYLQIEHGVMYYYRLPLGTGWVELADNGQCDRVSIDFHKEKPHYESEDVSEEKEIWLTANEIADMFRRR